jgi:hypothetical protein
MFKDVPGSIGVTALAAKELMLLNMGSMLPCVDEVEYSDLLPITTILGRGDPSRQLNQSLSVTQMTQNKLHYFTAQLRPTPSLSHLNSFLHQSFAATGSCPGVPANRTS